VIAIATPLGFQARTGAAVGGIPFTAATGDEARLPQRAASQAGNQGEGRVVAAGIESSASVRSCSFDRQGLVFYRVRYSHHRRVRGLATQWPVGRKPRNCADASYLAELWETRSRKARHVTERWQRSIGQVIVRLERGIREGERIQGIDSPMSGTGAVFERIGRRHGVSPFFMLAAAMTESSLGSAACSNNHRNVWGLASCNGSWYVPSFSSWERAVDFYARFLNRQWPRHSTPYSFRGYAACDACWGRKVSEWMVRLFGVPARTAYP